MKKMTNDETPEAEQLPEDPATELKDEGDWE